MAQDAEWRGIVIDQIGHSFFDDYEVDSILMVGELCRSFVIQLGLEIVNGKGQDEAYHQALDKIMTFADGANLLFYCILGLV